MNLDEEKKLKQVRGLIGEAINYINEGLTLGDAWEDIKNAYAILKELVEK